MLSSGMPADAGFGPGGRMNGTSSDDPPIKGAAYFAALAEQLHSEPVETMTLERICAQTLEVVPAAQYCGITLRRRRGRLETVVASHPLVTQGDALQYQLDEGPCVDAATDHGVFLVSDTASDSRWPRWGPRAADLGLRSLIAVQLSSSQQDDDSDALGAINIYAGRIDAFTRDDLDHAVIFATHAASALVSARVITGLGTAVHNRHLIGVAQGILMQRYGLSLERSFDALRRYSNETNIKLSVLAELVVQDRGLPEDVSAPAAAELLHEDS